MELFVSLQNWQTPESTLRHGRLLELVGADVVQYPALHQANRLGSDLNGWPRARKYPVPLHGVTQREAGIISAIFSMENCWMFRDLWLCGWMVEGLNGSGGWRIPCFGDCKWNNLTGAMTS